MGKQPDTCVLIGELHSHWESHAEDVRRGCDNLVLIVQWFGESKQAFVERVTNQLQSKTGLRRIVLSCNEEADAEAVAMRSRLVHAALTQCVHMPEVSFLVPACPTEGGIPRWAARLGDRVRSEYPQLGVAVRCTAPRTQDVPWASDTELLPALEQDVGSIGSVLH